MVRWTERCLCRGFSDGKAVDSIDTEKSRIILHEIESGWWILAVCFSKSVPMTSLIRTLTVHRSDSHHKLSRYQTFDNP